MKTLNYSISHIAMITFIAIAFAAGCVSAYFYILQTGIGEIGLHNQLIAGIAGTVSFITGIIACAFAFPYQNELKTNGYEEEVSSSVIALIAVVFLIMAALTVFSVYNNLEDQKNGSITANNMNFIGKNHISSFIAKNASVAMISPKVRITFSDDEGKGLSFALSNRDYESLFDDVEFSQDTKYEIEYYPNTHTLISVS